VVVKNTEEAIQALTSGVTDKYKLFIICETLSIAEQIAKAVEMKQINVGNIAYGEGKVQVSKSVFLNHQDAELLKKMVNEGYDLYIQMVPSEVKISAAKVLKEVS
jgi:fructoselysine and glucoselysine-specific PTS system IIB component